MFNGTIRRNQRESSCLDASVETEPLEIEIGARVTVFALYLYY